MKTIELIDKLRSYSIFSVSDLEKILDKDRHYVYLVLQRLKKNNLVHKVENGKYTCQKDPFIIASRLVWPSYISCWYALQYYNLTEQIPSAIEVITTKAKKRRKLFFMNVQIEFSRFSPRSFFGYNKISYSGYSIFIAEKEKAIADAFYLNRLPESTIKEILQNKRSKINIQKLLKYARKISKNLFLKLRKVVT